LAWHPAPRTGGDLRLRKPQGIVRKVLEVTGLASWIDDESVSAYVSSAMLSV
jgi:hypothetical protein